MSVSTHINYDTESYRFTPHVGQKVAVCYDGKWSRAVVGTVVSVVRRKFVVEFIPWASKKSNVVKIQVIRRTSKSRFDRAYGGWLVGNETVGIMELLGCRGDWYGVVPVEALIKDDYQVKGFVYPRS